MNEKFVAQLFAELTAGQEYAFAILAGALARQVDASRLADDLRTHLSAAAELATLPSATEQLIQAAAEAADAESAQQKQAKH